MNLSRREGNQTAIHNQPYEPDTTLRLKTKALRIRTLTRLSAYAKRQRSIENRNGGGNPVAAACGGSRGIRGRTDARIRRVAARLRRRRRSRKLPDPEEKEASRPPRKTPRKRSRSPAFTEPGWRAGGLAGWRAGGLAGWRAGLSASLRTRAPSGKARARAPSRADGGSGRSIPVPRSLGNPRKPRKSEALPSDFRDSPRRSPPEGVRLLDVGAPTHGFGQLAALLVAGGRAQEAGHGMFLHVFRHVEAHHGPFVVEEKLGQGAHGSRFPPPRSGPGR